MENNLEKLYYEYGRLLDSQKFVESELDYNILEKHIIFLEQLDVIENSAISIFDLYKRDHVFMSSKFETIFGHDLDEASKEGASYFDKYIHPEDLADILKAAIYFIKLGFNTPVENIKDYKMIYDYRRKNNKGKYIRVIEQQMALELDKFGNVWLALSLLDISPDKDIKTPFRCRLVDSKTGKLFHFPPKEEVPQLSNRETEILKLISEGLISKQIADMLFISVNTVNTHRQRIIEKLNVSNTFEAIKYGSDLGIF